MVDSTSVQSVPGAEYDAEYYAHHCGPVAYNRSEPQWPVVFGNIAAELIRSLQPRRVLDMGCALGFLVEAFWDRGVEAWGIDISHYAIANTRPDVRSYCSVASIADPITNGPFDLITSIEVLEHVPEETALAAIANMATATKTVLFSSTPFDMDEPTHHNVRPIVWWLRAFEQHGFEADLIYDASFVAPHAMLLRRSDGRHPAEVNQLFANMLRLRHESSDRQNQLVASAARFNAATTEFQQNLATVTMERDRGIEDIRRLEQQIAAAIRERGEFAALADALQLELDQARTVEQKTMVELQQATQDLDDYIRLRGDLAAPAPANAGGRQLNGPTENARLRAIEDALAQTRRDIGAILQSRTWQTLVWGGSLLERLMPNRKTRT